MSGFFYHCARERANERLPFPILILSGLKKICSVSHEKSKASARPDFNITILTIYRQKLDIPPTFLYMAHFVIINTSKDEVGGA